VKGVNSASANGAGLRAQFSPDRICGLANAAIHHKLSRGRCHNIVAFVQQLQLRSSKRR